MDQVCCPRFVPNCRALTDRISAYLLTTCAFQLFFGKLYTFFSIKWVYLSAIFIFEVGSVVCGAAPSSVALIIGRAIAGIGSAGIFSGALVIIAYAVPLVKRPIFTGIVRSNSNISAPVSRRFVKHVMLSRSQFCLSFTQLFERFILV